ncbi:MAG: hypothetical protein ACYS8Z_06105 [Planctomycetota bacterium]|jgi:hypothetical protein
MLSFLRDSGFDDLPAEKDTAAGAGSGDGKPGDGGQDYVEVTTNAGRVRRSTTLLAILLVVGLGCIWYMMKSTSPQPAGAATDANTTDIERAIVHITGAKTEMFGKMGDLVGKFNEFSDVPQVEVDELVKNPFELETVAAADAGEAQPVVVVDHLSVRRNKAQKQADELELLTIMQSGGRSSCMIDNRFLSEGDRIGDFTVGKIESDSVKLLYSPEGEADSSQGVSEKVEIILKLTE